MRKFADIKYLPLRPKGSTFDRRVTTMDWVIFAFLFIYGIIIIYPFYNAFLISISPDEVYTKTPFLLSPSRLIGAITNRSSRRKALFGAA